MLASHLGLQVDRLYRVLCGVADVILGSVVVSVVVVVVVTRSDVVTFLSAALLLFGDLTLPGIFD